MRWPPLLRWYMSRLRLWAQPRPEHDPGRSGLRRVLWGSNRARTGNTATIWAISACVLASGLALVVVEPSVWWWFPVVDLPLLGFAIARAIGTCRERYLW